LSVMHPTPARPLAPPLKWAGGKRWLVPTLRPIWSRYEQRPFVEPFVGGMAMALGLRPAAALLNDTNPHLINFYRWLQRGLVITIEMANDKDLYYRHRRRFNALIQSGGANSTEAASLFYYLNRTGFNGLCRFNNRGEFNVPFGRYTTIRYTTDFTGYVAALRGWQFSAEDFAALQPSPDAFIYADPPYDVEFTAYSPGGFSWQDQERFACWLARHPGPIVASNQATQRILELYRSLGFHTQILDAPRLIASNGDRRPAQEMLATKGL
jgi:DNA adenine methylase